MCETLGCKRAVEYTYLNAPICGVCKERIQAARFEGAGGSMAVSTFKNKHPFEWEHGHIEGYNQEDNR